MSDDSPDVPPCPYLVGECSLQDGTCEQVSITTLSSRDCRISRTGNRLSPQKLVTLWIGALGPFLGMLAADVKGDFQVVFDEPIAQEIVDHFGAT
jgi:hypothetical protein